MRHRRKRVVLLILLLLTAVFVYVRLAITPLVEQLVLARVDNRASYIINEAIEEQLRSEDIDYENIIILEKDVNGVITALKTNINEINRLKTQILSVIDTMLLDLDVNEIN